MGVLSLLCLTAWEESCKPPAQETMGGSGVPIPTTIVPLTHIRTHFLMETSELFTSELLEHNEVTGWGLSCISRSPLGR